MKKIFLAVMFLCLVTLSARDVQAQVYDSYYGSYWGGYQYQGDPQQYDPYYELHVMHYQLYLPQNELYYSCCFQTGIVVPGWTAPVVPPRSTAINPAPRKIR